jgi:hypothetical protein
MDDGEVEVTGGTVPAAGEAGSVEARMGAPHLLQKRLPGVILVPQALQNAIDYLATINQGEVGASISHIVGNAEWIADCTEPQPSSADSTWPS